MLVATAPTSTAVSLEQSFADQFSSSYFSSADIDAERVVIKNTLLELIVEVFTVLLTLLVMHKSSKI